MKLLFLCRGSVRDGLGHVTRSRAVARVAAQRETVRFVVIGDGCAEGLLGGRGFEYACVSSEPEALDIFHAFAPDIVIFDMLTFDRERCRHIARSATAISVSPIFDCMGEMALMFHRTAQLNPAWSLGDGGPEIRCGLQYSVVSSHCTRIPEDIFTHHVEHEMLAIAISMGGTDAANKTLRVLQTVKRLPRRLLIWVLAGEGYAHSYQALVDTMKGSPHEIILAKTNDSMWRILRMCSLAVLATGTTTYEAAYAGLPSINLIEDARNYFLIEELVENGACISPGRDFESALAALPDEIAFLEAERDRLLQMHRRGQSLIDGLGADRIARESAEFHAARIAAEHKPEAAELTEIAEAAATASVG